MPGDGQSICCALVGEYRRQSGLVVCRPVQIGVECAGPGPDHAGHPVCLGGGQRARRAILPGAARHTRPGNIDGPSCLDPLELQQVARPPEGLGRFQSEVLRFPFPELDEVQISEIGLSNAFSHLVPRRFGPTGKYVACFLGRPASRAIVREVF